MNRPFWTTLIVTASVSAVALIVQASNTRNLSQRLAEEKAKVATPKPQESREKNRAPLANSEQATALSPESEARVENAVTDVEKFIAGFGEGASDYKERQKERKEYMSRMPALLGMVKGLSTAELIAAAERLSSDPSSFTSASTKSTLSLLAAEQDPERVLRNENLMKVVPKTQVLTFLARIDPAAALRELPPMEPRDPNDKSINGAVLLGNANLSARIRYATMLLGVDLEGGLKALKEVAAYDPRGDGRIPLGVMGSTGIPSLPESSIPGLIDAIGKPEWADIRPDLIEKTVLDGLFKGGVATVAERMAAMDLTPEEMNRSIDKMLGESIMTSEPEAMLDWMSGQNSSKLPDTLVSWAETDVNAAGTWLGEQEASPIRDKAIAAFAGKANKLDPEAAAVWTLEIQDESMRQNTLRRVVKKWKGMDSPAAEKWVEENGISF